MTCAYQGRLCFSLGFGEIAFIEGVFTHPERMKETCLVLAFPDPFQRFAAIFRPAHTTNAELTDRGSQLYRDPGDFRFLTAKTGILGSILNCATIFDHHLDLLELLSQVRVTFG